MQLNMETARRAVEENVREDHLLRHALAVSAAMEAMAEHFGEDAAHWAAVGYAHDVDFERYPEEHCAHVRELLAKYDVDEEDLRAIESHGFGSCSGVEPLTNMEKSLYTVDELTGIISAAALMRPTGISDLGVSSLKKKFKDKRFAVKCSEWSPRSSCRYASTACAAVPSLWDLREANSEIYNFSAFCLSSRRQCVFFRPLRA